MCDAGGKGISADRVMRAKKEISADCVMRAEKEISADWMMRAEKELPEPVIKKRKNC